MKIPEAPLARGEDFSKPFFLKKEGKQLNESSLDASGLFWSLAAMRESRLECFSFDGPVGRLTGWTSGTLEDKSLTPVLFIHPINLAGACWAEVVSRLEPPRFCILLDLRGHGGSAASGPYGIDGWAEDCFAALDHFKIDRAHVVGGSLGGPLAVVIAARAPDRIASIAAFGSALKIEGEGLDEVIGVLRDKGVRETFRLLIPDLSVAPGTAPDVIEQIFTLTNPNDAETVTAIWTAAISTDVRNSARAVCCPALVVCGEHDKTCTPTQAAEMAKALSTDLVIIPGIGHIPMLEAPEATAALISRHLARHNGSQKAV